MSRRICHPVLRRYQWKTSSTTASFSSGVQWGLIAQEVDKVFPELMSTSTNGYYAVNYGQKIEMLLVEAVKELNAAAVKVKDGVARVRELIANKITAKTVVTDSLQMKDTATGAIYCVRITDGDFVKTAGQCGN